MDKPRHGCVIGRKSNARSGVDGTDRRGVSSLALLSMGNRSPGEIFDLMLVLSDPSNRNGIEIRSLAAMRQLGRAVLSLADKIEIMLSDPAGKIQS
jgi:hypothetical protein